MGSAQRGSKDREREDGGREKGDIAGGGGSFSGVRNGDGSWLQGD